MNVTITENKTYLEIVGAQSSKIEIIEGDKDYLSDAETNTIVEIVEPTPNVILIDEIRHVAEITEESLSLVEVGLSASGNASNEFDEIRLIPKNSSSGPEGTIFYSAYDKHVYVGVGI